MRYGKLPPRESSPDAPYPIYTGYRIAGYCNDYLYEQPQVLVVARGVGGTGDVKISPEKSWITNLSIVLAVDPEEVNKKFLYYRLGIEPLKDQLNTGAAQAQITIENLAPYRISIPSFGVQHRIADILSAYDDLIENDRRRIALLEEAARMLYREWFVHFRFPGHEHVRITDGLPEGWELRTLGDVVDNVKNPIKPADFSEEDVHIGLEHIPRRSFTLSDWEAVEDLASGKTRFEEGDILFCKIRPYFHKVGFTIRGGLASSDAIVWRVREKTDWPLVVCATSSDHFVAVASKTVREGSKMPRADWNVLKKYRVPKPPDGLLSVFNDTILPITAQCKALALQSRALAQARDLLLPRLMSGEIAV
jgi:type I restriction enzyme S subunit